MTLLSAINARNAHPLQRQQWIDEARAIVAALSPEELAQLPFDERLSAAAASYMFAPRALGFIDNPDPGKAREVVGRLTQEQRDRLADEYELQNKILKSLPVPASYVDSLRQVHEKTLDDVLAGGRFRALIARWGAFETQWRKDGYSSDDALETDPDTGKQLLSRKYAEALDKAGISLHDRMDLLNFIADKQAGHWHEDNPSLFTGLKPTQALFFSHDDEAEKSHGQETSLFETKDGGSYYWIYDRNPVWANMRGAIQIAPHEPQHAVQYYLAQKRRDGAIMPGDPLYETSALCGMIDDFGMQNYDPSVFDRGLECEKDRLDMQAYEAYQRLPIEVMSFDQGRRMELAVNHLFCPTLDPTVAPGMCQTFDPGKEPPVPATSGLEFTKWYASDQPDSSQTPEHPQSGLPARTSEPQLS